MKKTVLGGILALTLGLASCGGPTMPTPQTGGALKPAPLPTADAPEDATAAREYVFDKRQTRALAQSLSLGQLDTVDLGERLRVVLTVSRAKSGANIGKKKATATFIWGNQTVNLAGTYTLGVSAFGTSGALKAADGKLALAVKSPDFQAKASKSTAYVPDTGLLCARLTFNLSAGPSAWSSNTPVEVCEGVSERQAEQKALTTFSKGLLYRYQSEGASPWTFARLSEQPTAALPTGAAVAASVGLAGASVKTETFWEFFTGYVNNSAYQMTGQERRRWYAFITQFNIYYAESKIYKIRVSDERELIYLLGRNSYGVSGLWTYRFHDADGQGDPAYAGAKTYPYLGRYGGSLVGEVQIGPHAAGATVTGHYALRQSGTCSAGAGVTLDRELIQTYVFEPENGLTSTKFEIEATPDTEQDVVLDYALTVTYGGKSQTYTGFMCDIKPPPPPAPSVQDVQVGAWFERSPYLTTSEGKHEMADIWLSRFDGPAPESWRQWPYTQTAGGSYRLENAPECGAGQAQVLASGPLTLQVYDYVEMVGYGLALPSKALNNITPHSRLVYSVTVTGSDGTRTIDGAKCVQWED